MKKITLKFKPMILPVAEEREGIYSTLKVQLEQAQAMADNAALPLKLRLRAMKLVVEMAEVMGGILKIIADERFEIKLQELTEQVNKFLEEQRLEEKLRKRGRGKW